MPTLLSPPPFPPAEDAARADLLAWIREAPLVYGPWQNFKRLHKEAEAAFADGTREPQILAALMARLDAQPLEEGASKVAMEGNFGSIQAADGFAYMWANGRALQTYDLSSPAQPQLVSTWKFDEAEALVGGEIVLYKEKLWLNSSNRLWLFDLAQKSAPQLVSELDVPRSLHSIAGDNLIYWDGESAVRVMEVRDKKLVEVGACEFPQQNEQTIYLTVLQGAPGFAAASHYDYNSRAYKQQLIDLSDPANPKLAQSKNGDYSSHLQERNGLVYRQVNNDLQIFDVSDLRVPKRLGRIAMSGMRTLAHDAGRVVAFCQEWNSNDYTYQTQLRIVDVSRPSSPALVGQMDVEIPGYQAALAVSGDTLYAGASDGLHIFDISDPARAQEIGKSPKAKTFAYMKRRARRFLRVLGESDGTAFSEVAAAFFDEIKTRPNLDFDAHWIAADLVAAGHPNWYQASHGRGAYLQRDEALVIARRVERASAAWDAHPDALRPLLGSSVTAPVVHLARQVCGASEPLSPAQIESYVASRWPNLRVLGARAARAAIGELSARAVAGALFASGGRARRELLDKVGPSAPIASELASFLGESLPIERDRFGRRKAMQVLTRRAREIALLLAARFDLSDPAFSADGALPILRVLLGAGEAPLRTLSAQFCRRLSGDQILPLLSFAATNPAVLEALMESASRAEFEKDAIDKAVRAKTERERAVAWQLIEASQTSAGVLGEVWMSLFRGLTQDWNYSAQSTSWSISLGLQSAAGDANARACLVRGALDAGEVRPRWSSEMMGSEPGAYYSNVGLPGDIFALYALILPGKTLVAAVAAVSDAKWAAWKTPFVTAIAPHPSVCAKFWSATQDYLNGTGSVIQDLNIEQLRARTFMDAEVAATFGGAAGQLAPDLLLSVIGSVSDTVWNTWRAGLLKVLQTDAARREAFWDAARQMSFDNALLRARLIEDAEFAATFGSLESEVTQFDDPALEPLILTWLRARELDTYTLTEAATHPLPAVRALGIRELVERGLSVPIALRLLESDLRDAMDAAKNWFESRTQNVAALALALCDSPRLRARDYGREFVAARLESLIGDGLLEHLEENPNADTQSFVADLLLDRRVETPEPLEFDRAVLRGRNRARRAKTLVQTRHMAGAPLADDATLLELARGKTPRDAEWALQQLARRALENGVEGVEVGGVAAI